MCLIIMIFQEQEIFLNVIKDIMNQQFPDEIVAIKIVQLNSLKSKKLQQLLFQQIQILKKLNHPSVLKCYQIFTSNRNCYIITQLCNQGNLQNQLKLKKILQQSQANPIIKDVYDGLVYLAQNNIVHRDLKSANIFLHNGRAKIADFGFAKQINHNFKDLNIGSPLYMAPQGILHNIYGPKTQVWALGILVYELFHGSSPYIYCKTQQQLKKQVMIPLTWKQLRKDLSEDIKQFILTCLQINQQKRISIQNLSNLGYMRRLNQANFNYQVNKFDLRSTSKSVHLSVNHQPQNMQQIQKRTNSNFRPQNQNYSREVSMNRNNQRQVVFRSVDTRNNNIINKNSQNFQSPQKPLLITGSVKYDVGSPPPMKKIQLINVPQSGGQPVVQNIVQQLITMNPSYPVTSPQTLAHYQQNQQINIPLNSNNYQFRVIQQPNDQMIMSNNQTRVINGEIHRHNGLHSQQNVNRPLSSYNNQSSQQINFDKIGYNSANGFGIVKEQLQHTQNYNPVQTTYVNEHKRSISMSQNNYVPNTSYVFRDKLTFKQAIFFIHHCRLIFKFLFMYKDTELYDKGVYLKLFKYLMSMLTQLNKLAESNGVIAEGQKAGMKIKKFRQVNMQYMIKYRKQLQENHIQINPQPINGNTLQQIKATLLQILNRLNEEINSYSRKTYLNSQQQLIIVLGHLCIVLIRSLRQIQQSIANKNFKRLVQFRLIQTVLNTPKQQFTLFSYKNYKDQFIS